MSCVRQRERGGERERERERESKCIHNKNFSWGNYFFGLVFFLKIIKLNLFFKKTETTSNRPVLVLFFRTKTGSNRFGSVFLFWLGFFRFGLVFFLVWVRFGFFGFRLIKLKQTEPVSFFKILIGLISFFHGSVFLVFFLVFSV